MTETPVALVTGAAHRLGAATASRLHQRGWRVIIHYRSRPQQAKALVERFNQARPGSAIALAADLSQANDIKQLAQAAIARWGRLDGLVNNASLFYPTPTATASTEDWDAILNTNLRAPFLLVQQCLNALQQSNGAIVNLLDIYHQRPLANHPLYCASKAGLASLTQAWARDLAPNVRVNGVSPGAILWPDNGEAIDPDYQQAILAKTPLCRTGTPDDIAGAVAFLLCDAPFVTGQILAVDGGRSLNM
ncbi:pteridine reductase [Marinobacter sp. SS21]|uniref:pteridine reductase n=1 Tax=Marinobacter sp. SS21 TaxID=2979460 RepID=UPI00232B0CEF|nr:pteridine reductase [Marinobacter sp. SS21]MDC0663711.1 pteridine reductase [Marinobacter sp. SS21]